MDVLLIIGIVVVAIALIVYALVRLNGDSPGTAAGAGCVSGLGCGYGIVWVIGSICFYICVGLFFLWIMKLESFLELT